MATKILLSGVKPTGRPHIGNYFGAMKQFVDLQDGHDCYFMLADYHALNFIQNGDEMRQLTLDLAIDYLAIGLDPKKSVIFKQSDVSAHTELCVVFDTITPIPYLERAHAYKDAVAKNKEINVGTFNYPILMAADILLYDTDVVPVGQDNKQHVEYARDTAQKFNHVFKSSIFKSPKELIVESVKTVPGNDGRKMSKSYGNDLGLFASDDEIRKFVMSIVTDSSGERPENVYAIHALVRSKSELDKLYTEKKGKYKDLKEALIADLIAFIKPMRERREKIARDAKKVLKTLSKGADAARKAAEKKMEVVRKTIGVR
jgi:tryptophanyl-tRNA synthetase